MERNGNRLVLIGVASVVIASFYFISKNNAIDDSVNSSLVSSVEENKNNIKLIKESLDQLLASSNSNNIQDSDSSSLSNEQLNTTNNDMQKLAKRYDALLKELQALKQKSKQPDSQNQVAENSTTETESPAESISDMQDRAQAEQEKREEEWQTADEDSVATIEMQGELGTIFSSDQQDITVVNSECKSNGCKISLEVSSDFPGSPIPMLLDGEEGSFFSDKDFTESVDIDPETGQMKVTIFVEKSVKNEEG